MSNSDIILPRSILDTDLYKVPLMFASLFSVAKTESMDDFGTVDYAICCDEAFSEDSVELPLHPSFDRRLLFPSVHRPVRTISVSCATLFYVVCSSPFFAERFAVSML